MFQRMILIHLCVSGQNMNQSNEDTSWGSVDNFDARGFHLRDVHSGTIRGMFTEPDLVCYPVKYRN
jgi:hypothetical protein